MAGTPPVPLIVPDWPAPPTVKACATTRQGGYSLPPWDSFNLGDHVGDDSKAVAQNRALLAGQLGFGANQIGWLNQVHGTVVEDLPLRAAQPRADASTTTRPGQVCAVLTADCLPVLFCDRKGTRVAAAHAGWRGLLDGVLEETVACFDAPDAVLAWLGPAIGPGSFEVGPEVREAFIEQNAEAAACFVPGPRGNDRHFADIYALARMRLKAAGVLQVSGGGSCTATGPETFFSYRRDGVTGRQATLVWLSPGQ